MVNPSDVTREDQGDLCDFERSSLRFYGDHNGFRLLTYTTQS